MELAWGFIKDRDPEDCAPDWANVVDKWIDMFNVSGRFRVVPPVVCLLDNITARDYVESDVLDLDSLSIE